MMAENLQTIRQIEEVITPLSSFNNNNNTNSLYRWPTSRKVVFNRAL